MAFLLCAAIGGLWAVPQFTTVLPVGMFDIPLVAAIGAGATLLTSLVFYIIAPKRANATMPLIVYLLFLGTVGYLVSQTGGVASPFIALWMLLAFFSAVFGVSGVVLIFLATGLYVAMDYLSTGFSLEIITTSAFVSIVPTIVSLFVWRHIEQVDESTKHVRTLTNQLSEVASKSEIVINAIGDGVLAIDSVGVIQLINPAAQTILGWGKQDALMLNYKSVLQLLDENNHEILPNQDPIFEVLNTNQLVRSKDMTLQTKSGKKITVSMVVSPIGEVGSGVIAVFRDVTKEAQEDRSQAEFISTASHEMRTPVASIEGYLGLALNANTATVDIRARDFIMKAHEAAQHLGRLFQDLLDVSKSEDGRLTNIPKVVDLSAFTETIVEGLKAKAAEKNLALTYGPATQRAEHNLSPVYYVNQDNDHIREIINNLIENAIKYTPSGEVHVDLDGDEEKVVVSIKDTGLGIPAEDLPHLFQKFYRVSNPDRQSIGGTGLGLYLSRRLAEAMQGRLWVESIFGQGSTFFFELPRISTDEAERLKTQQAMTVQPAAAPTAFPAARVTGPTSQPPATPAPRVVPVQPVAYPSAEQRPVATPAPAPQPAPAAVQPAPAPAAAPAKTVPRGESLTPEQIAERVRELEALARKNQAPPAAGQ